MNNQHTPGPWFDYQGEIIARDSAKFICDPYAGAAEPSDESQPRHSLPIDERAANARLIAAAPELLEALCVALPFVEDALQFNEEDFKPGFVAEKVAQVRAAIAKAQGQA